MKLISSKEEFLENSSETLKGILNMVEGGNNLRIEDLRADETVFFIVDMINGFVKEGALSSPRIEEMTKDVVTLLKKCRGKGIKSVAIRDYHTEQSPEFKHFARHCIMDTSESEVIDEIKKVGVDLVINKNSTNAFLEDEFRKWLNESQKIKNFIIVGDCTDLCIQQFAITLKTYFNMRNEEARIIVPINCVETYDYELHNGDLMNLMGLYMMLLNGVEVIKELS